MCQYQVYACLLLNSNALVSMRKLYMLQVHGSMVRVLTTASKA